MSATAFRLRDLPGGARLALTLLMVVLGGGYVASALHLAAHHEDRDGRAGLTMDDLRGAYHGLSSRAPLARALEAGHPAEIEGAAALPARERDLLLGWVGGTRISAGFDDLDLGDAAPAEILAARCASCHARKSGQAIGRTLPFDYWDDVKRVAYGRSIAPVDPSILLASTHSHALALATLTIVVSALMLLTSWPDAARSGLPLLAAAGLVADLAAWWLARPVAVFVDVLVVAGLVHAAAMGAMILAVAADPWRRRA